VHDPGVLIAVNVLLLYTLLGPVVLFAIYVLFDFMNKPAKSQASATPQKKNPALWTREDIDAHLNRI